MNDRPHRTAPPALTEALDASLRDLAAGAVSNAADAQAEARRLLTDYETAHAPAERHPTTSKRAGTA